MGAFQVIEKDPQFSKFTEEYLETVYQGKNKDDKLPRLENYNNFTRPLSKLYDELKNAQNVFEVEFGTIQIVKELL